MATATPSPCSAQWHQQPIECVFPASRTSHSAVLINDTMVVFGGHGQLVPQEGRYDGGEGQTRQYGNTNDICMINLSNFKAEWLQPAPQVTARNRIGHSAVNVEGDMYVFGGWSGKKEKYLNFGFLFDMKSQQLMTENSTERASPPGRRDHTLTVVGSKMYLFGGWDCVTSFNDLWSLSFKAGWVWSRVNSFGNIPGPRRGHTATVIGTKIYVFGGIYGYTRFFDDVYCLDTKTMEWSIPDAKGDPPSPRAWHTAVNIEGTPYILIFGGSGGRDDFANDLHIFDTDTNSWSKIHAGGVPPSARCSHTAVTRGNQVYIFGGLAWTDGQLKPTSDLFILSITQNGAPKSSLDDVQVESVQKVKNSEDIGDEKDGSVWISGWLSTRHLRKDTVKAAYFKLTEGDGSGDSGASIRQLDCEVSAVVRLDAPHLNVEASQERLEEPLTMLLQQSKHSSRVQEYLKASEQNMTNEYPEFYLEVDALDFLEAGSKEYLEAAQLVYDRFLASGGKDMLTNVDKRARDKVGKYLKSGELCSKHWQKPLRSAKITMNEKLRDFLQNKQERGMTAKDKMQRTCMQCGIKFKDAKIKKVLCMYCLGIFCADCHGNGLSRLPVPYKPGDPEAVCRTCKAVLDKTLSTFRITGFLVENAGLFTEKDEKSKDPGPRPPQAIVLGVEGENERDSWVEALRDASVRESKGVLRKEGWVSCKPLWLGKGSTVLWTRKYAVLDGSVFRLIDLKFKELLPLVNWDVHSYNLNESSLDSPPKWMPTKTGYAYQFSVSNRNTMFKLGADSSRERTRWVKNLQLRLAEGRKKPAEKK